MINIDFKNIISQLKNIPVDFEYNGENTLTAKEKSETFNWEKLDKSQTLNSNEYIFYKLNGLIRNLLLDNSIALSDGEIIDLPGVAGPDFVLRVKEIFDMNKDKFQNIKQFSDNITTILKSGNISYIRDISQQGVFVNIFVNDLYFSDSLNHIIENDGKYGNTDFLADEKIIVEYSSPNMAKQMTVGHFRVTMIGQIVGNLIYGQGAATLRWNYLGDWGTPYGKNIYSLIYFYTLDEIGLSEEKKSKYKGFIGEELIRKLNATPISTLEFLYSSFKEIEDETKEDKARHYFKLLEKGYDPVVKLWEVIRKYSLMDFENIYKRLGVNFGSNAGESFTQALVDDVFSDLYNAGYVIEDNGACLVKFIKSAENGESFYLPLKKDEADKYEEKDITVMLLKKSDGATVYATRDMGLLKYRSGMGVSRVYYGVGNEQSLHLQTIFGLSDKLGYISRNKLFHIGNGLFLTGGEKMSSRKGNVHRMAELLDIVKEKISEDFQDKIDENTTEAIAISAAIFNEIKNDRSKDVEFNVENMTRINGDTGVYVQYSKVRLLSLLSKLKIENGKLKINLIQLSDNEKNIVKMLSYFPVVIKKAVISTKPHIFAQYILNLSQLFNSWYANSEKIMDMSEDQKKEKFVFLNSMKIVLEKGFELLNMPLVEKM